MIDGTGGAGSSTSNNGVNMAGTVQSTGTAPDAASITINGTGGAGTVGNAGVILQVTSQVSTIDGAILVEGIGAGNIGFWTRYRWNRISYRCGHDRSE